MITSLGFYFLCFSIRSFVFFNGIQHQSLGAMSPYISIAITILRTAEYLEQEEKEKEI
jgi:hypothetical protein